MDIAEEKARLGKELKDLTGEIERIEKKLSNQGFVDKAPQAVIEGEKEKLAMYQVKYATVKSRLDEI